MSRAGCSTATDATTPRSSSLMPWARATRRAPRSKSGWPSSSASERSQGEAWVEERAAVYGSTPEEPERHFIGWLGDVDPDDLFSRGAAWGLTVVRRSTP